MSEVLSGLDFCFAHLDDILMNSTSWKECMKHLEMVLKCLNEANLKIKVSKWQSFKKNFHNLGHLISKQGIQPLPENVLARERLKEPSDINKLCHFPGLTGYYWHVQNEHFVVINVQVLDHMSSTPKGCSIRITAQLWMIGQCIK